MIFLAENTLGTIFKVTSFGESHGKVIGIVIDGLPAGLNLSLDYIQSELDKRKPAQSNIASSREEPDKFEILSGIFNGKTTGAPLCVIIRNKDIDSSKYELNKDLLRPSQVDYTALQKFGGFADYRGSGRFSGRITAGYVIAGAIAKTILKKIEISILAYTKSIGDIVDNESYNFQDIDQMIQTREKSPVRALNSALSIKLVNKIQEVKKEGDSIGGTIKCIIKNVPPGIGSPVFNSLESGISKGIFSIPAIKGIEFGVGFKASKMKGSEHNDPWIINHGKVETSTNNAGGIIGGISTGMPIEFTVVVKPTPSISKPQKTVNIKTKKQAEINIKGRHDPCIVPRAVVVVEAIAAIVLLDFLMMSGLIPPVMNNKL